MAPLARSTTLCRSGPVSLCGQPSQSDRPGVA